MDEESIDAEQIQLTTAEGDPASCAIQRSAAPPPPPPPLMAEWTEVRRRGANKLNSFKSRLQRRAGGGGGLAGGAPDAPPPDGLVGAVLAALPRARSAGALAREARLRAIIAEVDGTGPGTPRPLDRTPSALADLAAARAELAAGVDPSNKGVLASMHQRAARNQRLRKQLRLIDAETAELSADLARGAVLRGDSATTARYECDVDCIVGGCGEQFAEHEGVRCGDCKLFLCFPCFGNCVTNECQVGGRFDKTVAGENGRLTEPGSLPCALFPQMCTNGHIPLRTIQRAMLHPANRGRDGADEDVHSSGHSPHKIHLMARRRWAEAEADAAAKELSEDDPDAGVALVRTFTERVARSRNATLSRSDADTHAALADKLDELEQLKAELARAPPTASIPAHLRRRCAQCNDQLAAFEGGECQYFSNRVERHSHFLCSVCFGGYIMKACSEGGVFEEELTNEAAVVVSAKGQLPCPFFQHLESRLAPKKVQRRFQFSVTDLPVRGLAGLEAEPEPESIDHSIVTIGDGSMPAMDCRCGAVPMSEIEAVLLDPRNYSFQYWRHRQPDVIVQSHESSTIVIKPSGTEEDLPPGWTVERDMMSNQEIYMNSETGEILFDRPSSNTWSREVELLGRGFTPANMHETARLRVALAQKSAVAAEIQVLEETRKKAMDPAEVALAELRVQVIEALDRGGSLLCPRCGTRTVKDDACIHIDSCPCNAHWCFLCGRDDCPRGGGGCDERSYYLEQHPGWGEFSLEGENQAFGAQQEFLRRRQAFMVRAVMEHTPPELWASLREKHSAMLMDTPTPGRSIEWESLAEAEIPVFGANLTRAQAQDAADPEAAKRRLQQYWEGIQLEQEAEGMRAARRWRHQNFCVPTVAILIALLVVGTHVLFSRHPPPNPALPIFYNETERAAQAAAAAAAASALEPLEPEAFSNMTNSTADATVYNVTSNSMVVANIKAGFDETTFAVQFLWWTPIVELVLGWLPFLWAFIQKTCRDKRQRWCSGPQVVGSIICLGFFWHVLPQAQGEGILESGWFVSYMWRPFCVFCNTIWALLIHFVWWAKDRDSGVWFACGCVFVVALPVCTIVCTAIVRHSYDSEEIEAWEDVATVSDADPAVFVCTWGCSFVSWFPKIAFLVGASMLFVSLLLWLKSRGNVDFNVPSFAVVSLVAAGCFFWPASIESVDMVDFSWFVSYMLAPFCCCFFGTIWLVVNTMCLIESTGGDVNDHDDGLLALGTCGGGSMFVVFEIAMVTFRGANENFVAPEAEEIDFEWTNSALWLRWAPIALLAVGAFQLVVSVGGVCFGRNQDGETLQIGMFCAVAAIVPFWPTLALDVEGFVSGNVLLVYYVLPACQAVMAPAWVAVTVFLFIEQVTDRPLHNFANERTLFICVCCACVLSTVAYISAMVTLRSTEWVPAAPPEFTYECNWPCIALRVFLSCVQGSVVLLLAFWVRSVQVAMDGVSPRLRCPLYFPQLVLLGAFGLAVSEAVAEWPISTPVESFITGSPLWMYCCVPLVAVLGFAWSYKIFESIALGDRGKLLSNMYDIPSVIIAASATGSGWLVYVLRHSADPTFLTWELSLRSKIIVWEILGTIYWGAVLIFYFWNFRQQGANWTRRHTCKLASRTLLLWVPCAAWPLAVLAAAGRDHDVLNDVYGRCPLAFLGLAVSLGGFVGELVAGRWLSCHACVRVCVSLLVGAAVLVANALLLLGGDCLSLWFQGLGRGWLLLEDACEGL